MRKHLIWLALCAGFGLSACTTLQTSHKATAKACANWRLIGIRSPSADQCPQVSGWKVSQLFDPKLFSDYGPFQNLDEEQDSERPSTPEVIQELNRFCVYESKDRDRKFPASAGLVKVDKDCAAIGRSSEAVWGSFAGHFLSQAGKPATPLEINNQLGVRLAFLDTQPTGMGPSTAPGNSHHGYTLTHIARHLVCSPAIGNRCAAQITTRLALPIVRFNAKHQKLNQTDLVRGGYIGTQSDLAQAIWSEVETWRSENAQKRLVLNLSVAWDGQLFDDLDTRRIDELRVGTQAVYQALRHAASLDVLVLAAAGNRKDCPNSSLGPLLPAAWEQGTAEDTAPLLYAVGGVGSDGRPLINARFEGMPRRAAYGENAGVPSWDPGRHTAFYTGSSVATAVASSIAAIVWDSFPNLTSHEVMNILDASGDELLFPADFWFGSGVSSTVPSPMARRLSLCTALKRACDQHPRDLCPLRSACVPWTPPKDPAPPRLASASSSGQVCHPWMHPQPEDPPCLNCHEPPPPLR